MAPGDPRSIDPAGVESDEEDVARTQGSSDPVEDTGRDGEDDRADALAAMPGGAGETEDAVTQRQPASASRSGDELEDNR